MLEWGSHCVDLCQWAIVADGTAPVEYNPAGAELHARYDNGVELIFRENGWIAWAPARCGSKAKPAGSKRAMAAISCQLAGFAGRPGRRNRRLSGDVPRPRLPRLRQDASEDPGHADAACHAHIACHAANIALFLGRKVKYDPVKNEFIGDEQANRLRSEALREPWRI